MVAIMAPIKLEEAAITDLTFTEDFPNSEIEFDQSSRNTEACYEYLARTLDILVKNVVTRPIGSVPTTSTSAKDVNIRFL